MSAAKYRRKYGKLSEMIALPCDVEMKRISDEAKRRKFDFNAWMRDVIADRMHEVTDECEIDPKEST